MARSSHKKLAYHQDKKHHHWGEHREQGVLVDPSKRQKTKKAITFSKEDAQGIHFPHNDAVLVTLNTMNYDVCHVLLDNGSLVDTLYYDAFFKMVISSERLERLDSPIMEFSGKVISTEGVITLLVTTGQTPQQSMIHVDFLIVKILLVYNAILKRPSLNALWAIVSTYNLMLKFPTKQIPNVVRDN